MMAFAGNGLSGRRVQYAALPYRVRRDGTVEVRLITSRETRRWVIPKGWPMKGMTPAKAAARETYEEAGLLGTVSRKPIGLYTYDKRLASRTVPCDVMVFPLKVKHQVRNWPERSQRFGFWFSVESAAAAVQEQDLKELILAFGELMARKWEAKGKGAPAKAALAKDGEARGDQAEDDRASPDQAQVAAARAKAEPGKAKGDQGKAKAASGKGKAAQGKAAQGKSKQDKARRSKAEMDGAAAAGDDGADAALAAPAAPPEDAGGKAKRAKTAAGKTPQGKTSAGKGSAGKTSAAKASAGKGAAGKGAAGKGAADGSKASRRAPADDADDGADAITGPALEPAPGAGGKASGKNASGKAPPA